MITRQLMRLALAAILILSTTLMASPARAAEATPVQALVAGNTAFAFDLYTRLQTNQGNLFFSPYSISTCLAMTYAGARGDTARQMSQALHFNAAPTELPATFSALQKQLTLARQMPGIELNLANGLWGQKAHPFAPAFLQIARQQYEANVNQVDFRTQADPARKNINAWVSDKTKGKITDLLPPGVLNADTRLVLVNAIDFKGRWESPFNSTNTATAPFTVTPAHKVQTPLMHCEAQFTYAETEGLQLLELPYSQSKHAPPAAHLSMVVLLPKELDGLKKLESSLTPAALNQWLTQARAQKVNVFLPKFKMTAQFSLAETLAAMGMSIPCSSQADFSGIDGARDLFISAIVHKAYVDVNEEGTEAAAATGTVMSMTSMMPRPTPVFRADHPFIFLIRDTQSGTILFLGRVTDPTK